MNKRSLEEQKELQRKGGKASGIARRKKADLKKAFETLLSLDVTDSKIKKQLEEIGILATMRRYQPLQSFSKL